MVNVTVNRIEPATPDYEVTLGLTRDEARLLHEWLGATSPVSRAEAMLWFRSPVGMSPSDTPEYKRFGPIIRHDGVLTKLYETLDQAL